MSYNLYARLIVYKLQYEILLSNYFSRRNCVLCYSFVTRFGGHVIAMVGLWNYNCHGGTMEL